MEAGLLPNDEVLALDANRITSPALLESALRAVPLGETAELLIARAGVVRPLSLTGAPRSAADHYFKEHGSERAAARLAGERRMSEEKPLEFTEDRVPLEGSKRRSRSSSTSTAAK